MASSLPSCSFYCRSASKPTSHGFLNRSSLPSPASALGVGSRVSVPGGRRACEARAKFEKFEGEVDGDVVEEGGLNSSESREEGIVQEEDDEDDRFSSVVVKRNVANFRAWDYLGECLSWALRVYENNVALRMEFGCQFLCNDDMLLG